MIIIDHDNIYLHLGEVELSDLAPIELETVRLLIGHEATSFIDSGDLENYLICLFDDRIKNQIQLPKLFGNEPIIVIERKVPNIKEYLCLAEMSLIGLIIDSIRSVQFYLYTGNIK